MARTAKDTADYFPHNANASSGDTLTVLQARHGNDGYALWFKLLEKLTAADGHYLDLRNPVKWQLFIAKMLIDEITTVEILNLLVEIEAIDRELWESKVIWCQNLVDNLSDVYKNRRREVPEKPKVLCNGTVETPISTSETDISTEKKPISTDDNPQSKEEESKEEENKVEKTNSVSFSINDVFDVYKKSLGLKEEDSIGEDMGGEIEKAIKIYGTTWIIDAINEAAGRRNLSWRYVTGILQNWKKYGKPTQKTRRRTNDDPDKYIKGKMGHLVQR